MTNSDCNSKEISSEMNGFACIEPWYRRKPSSLPAFKPQIKHNRLSYNALSFALNPLHGYKQTLFQKEFQVSDRTNLSTLKIVNPFFIKLAKEVTVLFSCFFSFRRHRNSSEKWYTRIKYINLEVMNCHKKSCSIAAYQN